MGLGEPAMLGYEVKTGMVQRCRNCESFVSVAQMLYVYREITQCTPEEPEKFLIIKVEGVPSRDERTACGVSGVGPLLIFNDPGIASSDQILVLLMQIMRIHGECAECARSIGNTYGS